MTSFLLVLLSFLPISLSAQSFSCPAGQADIIKYFAMDRARRADHFMDGKPNPIYTQVFPDADFAAQGYWFWLKSPKAHGFDVKSFDEKYVYMRSTELEWKDNTSFKRFEHDLPIAERCVAEGEAGRQIKVSNTRFQYFSSCRAYKSSSLGTAVNILDAPTQTEVAGNIGKLWTRVLHYHYNCDPNFSNCKDEEQFYLGNGYGLWQWRHLKNGEEVKSALINVLREGQPAATLTCQQSYR
jgi:hypothetical protein